MDLQECCKYVNSKLVNLISFLADKLMDDFQQCEVSFISQRHEQWPVRTFIHLDKVFSVHISTPLTRQYQQACLSKQNTIISLRVLGGEETKCVMRTCLATALA